MINTLTIMVARKPIPSTVIENVEVHGVGGINIDGCRIGSAGGTCEIKKKEELKSKMGWGFHECTTIAPGIGRWPANVILEDWDGITRLFHFTVSPAARKQGICKVENIYHEYKCGRSMVAHGDSGSAARFFRAVRYSEDD